MIIFDARYIKSVSLNFLETFRNYIPLLALTAIINVYGLDSLTPLTADLKCATTSIIYGIVIIFDVRYLKSASLNFLESFRN